MPWARILMIDEDAYFRRQVSEYLARKGIELVSTSRADIFAQNEAKRSHAVLLSRSIIEGNAELIQRMQNYRVCPLILISSAYDVPDPSLSAFIAEELIKPLDLNDLYNTLVSFIPKDEPSIMNVQAGYDGLCVNLADGTTSVDGAPVTLSDKEAELLCLLISNPDRIFSRDEIASRLWGRLLSDNSSITVLINHIRKKIGRYGGHIVAIRGSGYRFKP